MQAWILLKIFLSSRYSSHLLLLKYCLNNFTIPDLEIKEVTVCSLCAMCWIPTKILSLRNMLCWHCPVWSDCMFSLHSFIHSSIRWRIISGLIACTGHNLFILKPWVPWFCVLSLHPASKLSCHAKILYELYEVFLNSSMCNCCCSSSYLMEMISLKINK